MNAVRYAISGFIVVLLCLCAAGWRWSAANQPPAQALASHTVLLLAAGAGIVGLVMLWRSSGQTR